MMPRSADQQRSADQKAKRAEFDAIIAPRASDAERPDGYQPRHARNHSPWRRIADFIRGRR